MKKIIIILLSTLIVLFSTISTLAHIDNYLLPEECGSCHVGHGLTGEPMLNHSEEELCYQCHGTEAKRSVMKATGKLAHQVDLANMELEFNKIYRHPVKTGTGHSSSEKLPGLSSSAINHAECVDCHNPHQKINKSEKIYEVQGYSLSNQYTESSTKEYEICLKCHGSNIGIKSTSKNYSQVFALRNKSQHPVTINITNNNSTSLKLSMKFDNSLNCSDCHSNDQKDGPKGPHGSRYKYLLNGNYDTDVYNIESIYAYEFCYACHDRTSILSNESFPFHKEHIIGDPIKNRKGTSCYTCHASHSSEDNHYLINFNPAAVSSNDASHKVEFDSNDSKTGECFLKCHDYSHNPGTYLK